MKLILITSMFALFLVNSVQARIGETMDECAKRYGHQVRQSTYNPSPLEKYGVKTLIFTKEGIGITCSFLGTKCGSLSYTKLDGGKFSPEEIDALLDANGTGWILSKKLTERSWENATGIAILSNFTTEANEVKESFTFLTNEFQRVLNAATQADNQKKLQGF